MNLVRFNPDYDSFECGEPWAHRTLAKHAADHRPVLYTERQLEQAETHDPLVECRANADGHDRMDAQLHAHVLGKEDSGVEPFTRRKHTALPCASMTSTNSMGATRTATPGSRGRSWESSTGHGSNGPSSGRFATCQATSTGRKFDSKKYIRQNLSAELAFTKS